MLLAPSWLWSSPTSSCGACCRGGGAPPASRRCGRCCPAPGCWGRSTRVTWSCTPSSRRCSRRSWAVSGPARSTPWRPRGCCLRWSWRCRRPPGRCWWSWLSSSEWSGARAPSPRGGPACPWWASPPRPCSGPAGCHRCAGSRAPCCSTPRPPTPRSCRCRPRPASRTRRCARSTSSPAGSEPPPTSRPWSRPWSSCCWPWPCCRPSCSSSPRWPVGGFPPPGAPSPSPQWPPAPGWPPSSPPGPPEPSRPSRRPPPPSAWDSPRSSACVRRPSPGWTGRGAGSRRWCGAAVRPPGPSSRPPWSPSRPRSACSYPRPRCRTACRHPRWSGRSPRRPPGRCCSGSWTAPRAAVPTRSWRGPWWPASPDPARPRCRTSSPRPDRPVRAGDRRLADVVASSLGDGPVLGSRVAACPGRARHRLGRGLRPSRGGHRPGQRAGLVRTAQAERRTTWRVDSADVGDGPVPARARLESASGEDLGALDLRDGRAQVLSGDPGRLLALADTARSSWSARLDGTALSATTVDGWAQGFLLPAAGGTLEVDRPGLPPAWGVVAPVALALLVVALLWPGRRHRVRLVTERLALPVVDGRPAGRRAGAARRPGPGGHGGDRHGARPARRGHRRGPGPGGRPGRGPARRGGRRRRHRAGRPAPATGPPARPGRRGTRRAARGRRHAADLPGARAAGRGGRRRRPHLPARPGRRPGAGAAGAGRPQRRRPGPAALGLPADRVVVVGAARRHGRGPGASPAR